MSDNPHDTPHDDLHDAATSGGWPPVPETSTEETGPRVGFCQDCGKPLTAQTVRTVGTGVFCEPCLAARIGATGPTAGPTAPPFTAGPFPPIPPTSTSPVLAAFLGLIPGVGAMYNGQFAKAVAHLAIFVVLKLMEDVSSVFGIFVFGWIIYQSFDAYHTAKARMEGLPLPNPFGLNDIGERMGFGKNWPNAGSGTWGSTRPAASAWQAPPTPGAPPPTAGAVPPAPAPPVSGPDWVGYVPPTHFASYAPPPPTSAYTPPGHGAPYTPVTPIAVPVPEVIPDHRSLPIGALWLIGLGVFLLAATLLPSWGMSERWAPPILFAGLALYVLQRRLRRGTNLLYALRAPAVLLTLAIFGAFHAAEVHFNPGLFVAVLFLVIGSLLLIERTVGTLYSPVAVPVQRASFIPVAEPPAPVDPAPPTAGSSQGEIR